jgi:hypothetical protein
MNYSKTPINRKLYGQISAFIMPKPCGFSTPRTRMPAGIRGHALQRRDSGRHHPRLIFVSFSDRSHGLLKSPQSTQRAQSCATPVTTFEKAAASRFRTRVTRIARIFTETYESARFVFHYIPTEFITLFNNILFLEKTIHEI